MIKWLRTTYTRTNDDKAMVNAEMIEKKIKNYRNESTSSKTVEFIIEKAFGHLPHLQISSQNIKFYGNLKEIANEDENANMVSSPFINQLS